MGAAGKDNDAGILGSNVFERASAGEAKRQDGERTDSSGY